MWSNRILSSKLDEEEGALGAFLKEVLEVGAVDCSGCG